MDEKNFVKIAINWILKCGKFLFYFSIAVLIFNFLITNRLTKQLAEVGDFFIGLSALLAVWKGSQYLQKKKVLDQEDAKKRIWSAIEPFKNYKMIGTSSKNVAEKIISEYEVLKREIFLSERIFSKETIEILRHFEENIERIVVHFKNKYDDNWKKERINFFIDEDKSSFQDAEKRYKREMKSLDRNLDKGFEYLLPEILEEIKTKIN